MRNFHKGRLGLPVLSNFIYPAESIRSFKQLVELELFHREDPSPEILSLRDEVENDPDFKSMNGLKIAYPFGGRFEIRDLAMWFIWRANELGLRKARSDLRKFKQSKTLTGKFISPIIGFRTDKRIKLSDDYLIEPFDQLPIFEGKMTFSPARGYITAGPVHYSWHDRCALTFEIKYKIGDEAPSIKHKVSDEAFSICLIASCLENTKLSMKRLVFASMDNSPFGFFRSSSSESIFGKDLDFNTPAKDERYSLDLKLLRLLLKREDEINIPDHVGNAIYHLWEAKFRQYDRDAYIALGMALEIALNKGDDGGSNRDSISSSVKRRAAWLLGKNYSERKEIFDQVGRIYTLRSKIVHTGIISTKSEKMIDRKLHENLVSRLLQKLIMSSEVNFDVLTLGG